jgi:hypothetical protein
MDLLASNKFVSNVELEPPQTVIVNRPEKGDLRLYLTNTYMVGEASAGEILANNPGIDAIVTMSQWNGYTGSAKMLCAEENVGLFKFNEVLGAAYYSGQRFINYSPPTEEEREKRRKRYRW